MTSSARFGITNASPEPDHPLSGATDKYQDEAHRAREEWEEDRADLMWVGATGSWPDINQITGKQSERKPGRFSSRKVVLSMVSGLFFFLILVVLTVHGCTTA